MKVEEVKALGRALLVSKSNVNNCSTLLALITSTPSQACFAEAVRCLQAFFLPALKADDSLRSPGSATVAASDAATIYRAWLADKYQEFLQVLVDVLAANVGDERQKVALAAIMELIQVGKFDRDVYFKLWTAMIDRGEFKDQVVDTLVTEYFPGTDTCQLTLRNVDKLVERRLQPKGRKESRMDDDPTVSLEVFTRNAYRAISKLSAYVQSVSAEKTQAKSEGKLDDKTKKLRSRMQKIWVNFLQLSLPLDMYKTVLTDMAKVIIPTMPNPLRLSDFLTKSYDLGGVYSVMALDGLFILMTKHALEYPEFYDKLYSLLEPSVFFTKYRSRFFELVDTCLRSPLLPSYLAAAFAKKLSRLSLSASPAGALVVIAMVHNLLRRHPSINCLVHRSSSSACEGKDPFDINETKPSQCKALESSLWELESLRRHNSPNVSRFVASLETDLTVRAKTTEVNIGDFSSGSYSTIMREETKRRVKQVPLAFYKKTPATLFPEDAEGGEEFSAWNYRASKRQKVI